MQKVRFAWLITPATLLGMCLSLFADVNIFSTDFTNYPVGNDQLVGFDGWDSDANGLGLHGIDVGLIPDKGKSAFLGLNPPDEDYISVWRPLDYSPLEEKTSTVRISATVAVIDSTNGKWDNFFISLNNQDGDALASINFDNSNFFVFIDDTSTVTNTQFEFVPDTFYQLEAVIDFAKNEWSASLDGEVVFNSVTFHGSSKPLNLGNLSFEWLVTNLNEPGNNWMTFDDISFIAEEDVTLPPSVPEISTSLNLSTNQFQINWSAAPQRRYQVEYSADLKTWNADLPNSLFITQNVGETLTFLSEPDRISKFYRLTVSHNN